MYTSLWFLWILYIFVTDKLLTLINHFITKNISCLYVVFYCTKCKKFDKSALWNFNLKVVILMSPYTINLRNIEETNHCCTQSNNFEQIQTDKSRWNILHLYNPVTLVGTDLVLFFSGHNSEAFGTSNCQILAKRWALSCFMVELAHL